MSFTSIARIAALFVVTWLTSSASHGAVTNIVRVTGPNTFAKAAK